VVVLVGVLWLVRRAADVRALGTRRTVGLMLVGWGAFNVVDEITGESWRWGEHNYVRLDPFREPAHILSVRRA